MRRPHLVLAAPLLLALTTCAAAPTSTAIHDAPAPPPAPPTSTAIHDAPAPPTSTAIHDPPPAPAPPTSTAIHDPPPAPAPRLDVRAGPVVADDPPPQSAPDHSVESAAPPPAAPTACCRRCHKGKACGNTCIAADKRCEHPPGCACDV